MLTAKEEITIRECYRDSVTEQERKDTILELSTMLGISTMDIRQFLQLEGMYMNKEGKTTKEQYANALWAVTGITKKEWMKLTLKSQRHLMDIFKRSNHEETEDA
jgi:hypothetical protein